jgi:hypothetical protein
MIVKDKDATRQNADKICKNLFTMITNEMVAYTDEDDPAEIIYALVHIAGNLNARICLGIEQYGKIYNIKNMTAKKTLEWIKVIANEHNKANKNV